MTDPIADMLTRIRNGFMAKKTSVSLPHSKLLAELVEKLIQLNYLQSFSINKDQAPKSLVLHLKYHNKQPVMSNLKRISKPGRRVYVTANQIPTVLAGYGSVILSTSQGLMTNIEAKKAKIGGEVICKIW